MAVLDHLGKSLGNMGYVAAIPYYAALYTKIGLNSPFHAASSLLTSPLRNIYEGIWDIKSYSEDKEKNKHKLLTGLGKFMIPSLSALAAVGVGCGIAFGLAPALAALSVACPPVILTYLPFIAAGAALATLVVPMLPMAFKQLGERVKAQANGSYCKTSWGVSDSEYEGVGAVDIFAYIPKGAAMLFDLPFYLATRLIDVVFESAMAPFKQLMLLKDVVGKEDASKAEIISRLAGAMGPMALASVAASTVGGLIFTGIICPPAIIPATMFTPVAIIASVIGGYMIGGAITKAVQKGVDIKEAYSESGEASFALKSFFYGSDLKTIKDIQEHHNENCYLLA